MLSPGTVFAHRYLVIRPIGSGGFGAVYEAEHLVTERRVAVKTLWPHLAADPTARSRFLRESRLAAQVQSEYIAGVLDAGVDEATNSPFLVMELLEGENLNARLRRKRTFSEEECVLYLAHVAAALERTHASGIVHCDLKPANLFLTRRLDGSPLVKVLDFGIAKALIAGAVEASLMVGTPIYMAPEQFTSGTVGMQVDVYALAQIAFRFLVGQTYFRIEQRSADGVFLLALAIADGPPELASVRAQRYGAKLDPRFDAWFACAAHARPDQRFTSATQAVLALAWTFGLPPPALLSKSKSRKLVGALTMAGDVAPQSEPEPEPAPSPPLEPTLCEPATISSKRARLGQLRRYVLYGVLGALLWCGAVSIGTYTWMRLHPREFPDVDGVPAEMNLPRSPRGSNQGGER